MPQRHPQRTKVLVVVLAIAVVAGLAYLVRKHHQNEVEAAHDPVATATPSYSATPKAHPRKHHHRAPAAAKTQAPAAPGVPAGILGQLGSPNGLAGNGGTSSAPRHHLGVTISGSAPLGHVYYVVPTSNDYYRGSAQVAGTQWSMGTTVWGPPKYGAIGVQANYRGAPVSCTVTVDGRVTDHQTSRGPYSFVWCVG